MRKPLSRWAGGAVKWVWWWSKWADGNAVGWWAAQILHEEG